VLYGNVGLCGLVGVINCGDTTSPAVSLSGSAGAFDRLEVFNATGVATPGIEVTGAYTNISELYLEGDFTVPVSINATKTVIGTAHVNLGADLGTIDAAVVFGALSNFSTIGSLRTQLRTGTTVTNIIDDQYRGKVFPTVVYDFDDKMYSYSQMLTDLNALTHHMIVTYTRDAGISGGTFNSGAWNPRELNTVEFNGINDARLVNNIVHLPKGVYKIQAEATGYKVDAHKCRLYDTTVGVVLAYGSAEVSDSAGNTATVSRVSTVLTLTQPTTLRLEHQCATTNSPTGYGLAAGFGDEVYTTITVEQIFGMS